MHIFLYFYVCIWNFQPVSPSLFLDMFKLLCKIYDIIYSKSGRNWVRHEYSNFENFFLLLCCVGVHCSIYKGSYNVSNISYLNSPPALLSISFLSPNSWNSFNRYHFCIYVYVYTLFALYSLGFITCLSRDSISMFCMGQLY
jgi:hypothetical protein